MSKLWQKIKPFWYFLIGVALMGYATVSWMMAVNTATRSVDINSGRITVLEKKMHEIEVGK